MNPEETELSAEVPELAWIAALTSEGKYVAAAEAAERAYRSAAPGQRFLLLTLWEDIAFEIRPAGVGIPHPSVAGVVPALEELIESGLADAQRAILMARLARQESWPDPSRPSPRARAAVALAREIGDQAALIEALSALHITIESASALHERLAISSELVGLVGSHRSPAVRAMAYWRRQTDCLMAGDSTGYDHHVELLQAAAAETGEPFWKIVATIASTTRELLHGNYDRAEQALPALAEGLQQNNGLVSTAISSVGLLARFQRGRGSEQGLSRMLSGVRAAHVAFRVGLAYYLATSGRPTEARAEIGEVDLHSLPDDAGRVPCLCMATELACAYFDDRTMAEQAYELLRPYEGQFAVTGDALNCLGPVDFYLGTTAGYLGLAAAAGHLQRARDAAATLRARPWLAKTLLLLGRRETDPEAAKTLLGEALSISERIGYPAVANEARAALRPAPTPRVMPSKTELTPREREILGMTALGMTAPEVAARLVLSPRTVEKHLENAYAKIGARNRAEGTSWAIVNGLTEDA
ncbi:MAG: response regulator transcription factor [Dehalococcoidia bacterium]